MSSSFCARLDRLERRAASLRAVQPLTPRQRAVLVVLEARAAALRRIACATRVQLNEGAGEAL
jgi:hypothetical protein